jgi:hypothetical protein
MTDDSQAPKHKAVQYLVATGTVVMMVAVCCFWLSYPKGTAVGQLVQVKYDYYKPFFLAYTVTAFQLLLALGTCIYNYIANRDSEQTDTGTLLSRLLRPYQVVSSSTCQF